MEGQQQVLTWRKKKSSEQVGATTEGTARPLMFNILVRRGTARFVNMSGNQKRTKLLNFRLLRYDFGEMLRLSLGFRGLNRLQRDWQIRKTEYRHAFTEIQ